MIAIAKNSVIDREDVLTGNLRKTTRGHTRRALDGDSAKKVSAAIKDAKLKKVQSAIQCDQVRVSSPS